MKKLFDSEILDEIFETRRDGFENALLDEEEPLKIKEANLLYDKTVNKIMAKIQNKKEQNEFTHLIESLDDSWIDKMCFWQLQYYKLGFCDAYNLQIEVKENDFSFKMLTINYDNFAELFEIYKSKNLYKKQEYIDIENQIKQIKLKYPNVRNFIEDGEATNFSNEEQQAILTLIKLESSIEVLEIKEAFNLGIAKGIIV